MPLEGTRMLAEALEAGVRPTVAFFVEGTLDPVLARRLQEVGTLLHETSSRVVGKLSDLPSARGVVALASPPSVALGSIDPGTGIVVLLDSVQDPANAGAVVRSAEAFGARAVLFARGSARPFSARTLRSSAGSVLRVPVVEDVAPEEAVEWARARGALLAGAEARDGSDPSRTRLPRPLVLVVGSEGQGISPALSAALDVRLTIPLGGRVESLNAAVAAGLLLWELSKGPSGTKER
jgi:TrmH family RNA methyltransferase